MKDLRKIYETELQRTGLHSEIEKAKEAFEVKPFVQEFLKLKQLIVVLRPALSVFSIITGFGFLFYQFKDYLNIYVAVVIAIALLVGIELVKAEPSTLAFKRAYIRASALTFALALFAIAFFGLSVFLSVNGAKEIYKTLDTKTTDFKTAHQTKRDSIANAYDTQIKAEKDSLQSFKKSVHYNGKINISNPNVGGTITAYEKRIDNLLEDKRKDLYIQDDLASVEIDTITKKTGFDIEFWFWLSLGIEFSILLCLWFLVFFAYRTSKESEIFNHSPHSTLTEQLNDFLGLVNVSQSNSMGLLNTPQNNLLNDLVSKHENQGNLKADKENAHSLKQKKTSKKTYALSTEQREKRYH